MHGSDLAYDFVPWASFDIADGSNSPLAFELVACPPVGNARRVGGNFSQVLKVDTTEVKQE